MRVVVVVRLEVECDNPADAYATVDGVLDTGVLQDAIKDFEEVSDVKVLVTSATCAMGGDS